MKRKVLVIAPFSTTGTHFHWMRSLLSCQRQAPEIDLRLLAFNGRLPYPFRLMSRYVATNPMTASEESRCRHWLLRCPVTVLPKGLLFRVLPRTWAFAAIKQLETRWSGWAPDLIHAHWLYPYGMIAKKAAGHFDCPFIITAHGGVVHRIPRDRGFTREVLKLCHSSSRVSCVGNSLVQKLHTNGVPISKLQLVHNGVDLAEIEQAKKLRRPSLPAEKRYVVTIGRLIPGKGHDLTLQAIARLRTSYPDLHLLIIGDGSMAGKLKGLAATLGISQAVTFFGRLSFAEAMRILHESTVFCLPSHEEGFGLVYAEAMACGKPVIATRGQGISDLIETWNAGLLVEPDSADSVTEALDTLLKDSVRATEMAQRGRQRVREGFSWAGAAARYNSMYLSVGQS